jgi:hypothetical protein
MIRALALLMMLSGVDAGTTEIETPEITKEDVWAYRKVRFEQLAQKMQHSAPPSFVCRILFNPELELALWECQVPSGHLAALFVWQNEDWAKVPGTFAD